MRGWALSLEAGFLGMGSLPLLISRSLHSFDSARLGFKLSVIGAACGGNQTSHCAIAGCLSIDDSGNPVDSHLRTKYGPLPGFVNFSASKIPRDCLSWNIPTR